MKPTGKLIFAVLFLTLFFCPRQSKATHAFGAELTYTCIDSNTYVIWYTLYRDCSGIQPSATILINVTNTCGFPTQSFSIGQISSGIDLVPLCPQDVPTTCQGGIHIGVQKFVYSDTVVLTGTCNWTISHGESARSSSLTTIAGAGSDDLYVYCLINNSQGNNNSPIFLAEPLLYVCLGTSFSIDQQIYDVEGDSLTMQLITPLTSAVSIVSYFAGYSSYQPLISSPLMTFNSTTGIFSGRAMVADYSVYALLVNEYRNGVLIGQVERDLSLIAQSCSNTVPNLSGFDGSSNFNIAIPPNSQSCFMIAAIDPDFGQTTTISLNSAIGGLSFSHTGTYPDTANVCWTPTFSDSLSNPNCFSLLVTDDACPFLSSRIRTFCLDVSLINSIQEKQLNSISISPNPFQNEIILNSTIPGELEIKLVELSGREVYRRKISSSENKLYLGFLEKGIYLLSIESVFTGEVSWRRVVRD